MIRKTNTCTALPRNWVSTTIEEIAATSSGGTPSRSHKDYYGGSIPWVKSGELKDGTVFRTEELITELGLRSSSAKIFPAGTLCIALYGATVGRLGTLAMDAATNQAVCGIFVPKMVSSKYLFHFLFSQRRNLIELGKGGAQPNISQDIVRGTAVPLAPLEEQQRIVAKIEELLTKLDAGVEALLTARAQVKRYRQSVLKAAVTGELTKQWRESTTSCQLVDPAQQAGSLLYIEPAETLLARVLKERRAKWEADQLDRMEGAGNTAKNDDWKNKYREPASPDTRGLPELPKTWIWTYTQQLGEVQLGRQRSPKNRSKNHPTKYIRAANITESGFDLTDVLDMEFEPNELKRYQLHEGDILLSEASGSPKQVGKPAIWHNHIPDCCFQNTVIRLRPFNLPSEYIHIVFKSLYANGVFATIAAGVGINHLSADKFSTVTVPLPPLPEQTQIFDEVERLLSIAEAMKRTIEQSLKQSERMRQSILKQAFEGKLVPQDPNDEPAEVLLERIKIERAKREAEKSEVRQAASLSHKGRLSRIKRTAAG